MMDPKTMTNYPIKVRWTNDSEALNKFLTREIEPLKGSPSDKRDVTDEELETVATAICGRQKTNVVIENDREKELVLERLEGFANGIGDPVHGGEWATSSKHKAVKRVIEEIQSA